MAETLKFGDLTIHFLGQNAAQLKSTFNSVYGSARANTGSHTFRNTIAETARKARKTTAADILRIAGLVVGLMLAQIAQSSDAPAYVSCTKIDELQADTDPAIAALIERHYGTKDILVAALDQRFLLVRLGSADCPKAGCLYRLVQVADGAVQERFAFQSGDWITTVSPLAYYVEALKNLYATFQLDTSDSEAILIHLPKKGSVVIVSTWSGRRSLPRCGQSDK